MHVMYSYITMSHRTQITLTDEQYERLIEESKRSGAALAELVRRAIDQCYGRQARRDEFLRALDATAGLWSDRDFTTEEYLRRVRGPGLGERLAEIEW
jgi:hypothetical protein